MAKSKTPTGFIQIGKTLNVTKTYYDSLLTW